MPIQRYLPTLPSKEQLEADLKYEEEHPMFASESYEMPLYINPDGSVTFVMMETSLTAVARELMGPDGKVLG